MKPAHIQLNKDLVEIDPGKILFLLGNQDGDAHTLALIEKYISLCRELMTPCGGHLLLGVKDSSSKEVIEVKGISFETGNIVTNLLRNAEAFAFIIVTAGPGPESLSKKLIEEGQFLDGYIVDLIGSAIVGEVAKQLHQMIEDKSAAQGKKVTNLYSPGYCTWNVGEQQKLFSLFPAGFCGVTLSGSSLMSPIKSISGIIGIGKNVIYRKNNCEICTREECVYRTLNRHSMNHT